MINATGMMRSQRRSVINPAVRDLCSKGGGVSRLFSLDRGEQFLGERQSLGALTSSPACGTVVPRDSTRVQISTLYAGAGCAFGAKSSRALFPPAGIETSFRPAIGGLLQRVAPADWRVL